MTEIFSDVEAALQDFKDGKFIIVTDDESRENMNTASSRANPPAAR